MEESAHDVNPAPLSRLADKKMNGPSRHMRMKNGPPKASHFPGGFCIEVYCAGAGSAGAGAGAGSAGAVASGAGATGSAGAAGAVASGAGVTGSAGAAGAVASGAGAAGSAGAGGAAASGAGAAGSVVAAGSPGAGGAFSEPGAKMKYAMIASTRTIAAIITLLPPLRVSTRLTTRGSDVFAGLRASAKGSAPAGGAGFSGSVWRGSGTRAGLAMTNPPSVGTAIQRLNRR